MKELVLTEKRFRLSWLIRTTCVLVVAGLLLLGAVGSGGEILPEYWIASSTAFSPDRQLDRLIRAIVEGDARRARSILENRRADLNRHDLAGITPLRHAINVREPTATPLVALLLAHGADPNVPDASGTSPLVAAVAGDCPIVVETLLAAGADPNARRNGDKPPLHFVAPTGSGMQVAMHLVRAGADPAARDAAGDRAWEQSRLHANAELVRYLQQAAQPDDTVAQVP